MKVYRSLLLCMLPALLASCSSTDSIPGGLVGLLSGGLIGHLADQNISNPYATNGTNGTVVAANGTTVAAGTTGTTVAGTTVAGTTGDNTLYDNKGMIVGAASGLAAGTVVDMMRKGEIQKKYDEGYSKGKSDSIKELYWLKREAQKHANGDEPQVQYRYYEVEVPAHTTSDGVYIERHKQVIEVVE